MTVNPTAGSDPGSSVLRLGAAVSVVQSGLFVLIGAMALLLGVDRLRIHGFAALAAVRNDPLIGDARRLSIPTYASLLDYWDGTRAVHALHKPLLLIQGRHDRMQPPRQSELLFEAANHPKRYELLNTGHLPHLQDPDMLADLLIGWLDGLV